MTVPKAIAHGGGKSTHYERSKHDLEAVSTSLITGEDSERIGLNYARVEPPIDYTAKLEQEIVVYFLEGSGTMIVEGEEFAFEPGSAILIPADHEHRHRSSEHNSLLVIWSPPPSPAPRHGAD